MDDKVRFTVRLEASSNISYHVEEEIEVDRDEWDGMSVEARRKYVEEIVEETVWSDISGSAEFTDPADDPDRSEEG